MDLWKSIKTKFGDSVKFAGNKTVKMTNIGRIKIDVLALKKEIEEKLVELGGRIYKSEIKDNTINLKPDKAIMQLIEQIKELESELNDYKVALEKIKNKKDDN